MFIKHLDVCHLTGQEKTQPRVTPFPWWDSHSLQGTPPTKKQTNKINNNINNNLYILINNNINDMTYHCFNGTVGVILISHALYFHSSCHN